VELRHLISLARPWLPVLLVVAVLSGAASLAVSLLQQKTYEAQSTLIVGQSLTAANPDYNQLLVSQGLATTYATVAMTRPVLQAAIDELHLSDTPDELIHRVRADAPLNSTLLTITADAPDPAAAAALANSIADNLVTTSRSLQNNSQPLQQSVDAELAATQAQIDSAQARVDQLTSLQARTPDEDTELANLEDRLASLRSTYASLVSLSSGNAANLLSIVDPAVAPTDPVSPRIALNTILGALLGALVAAGLAFVIETFNDSIRDAEAVRSVADVSTLGRVARMRGDKSTGEIYRMVTLLYPRSADAEAYRTLRTNVGFATLDAPVRSLLVTSAVPGEGKTVTAANLAVAFAQTGATVLLVDADLRKPGVNQILGLENRAGLTTLLRGSTKLEAVAQATEQSGLRVITTGPLPPNPAELLGSQRMAAVLASLAESSDLVILDSPPLQAVTDASILSTYADGTLLVIDARRGHRRAVREARDALTRAGANVIGAVLNRLPERELGTRGAYYYSQEEAAAPPSSAQ
jgi:succinoglycan biosynthesis transport protein ExoP